MGVEGEPEINGESGRAVVEGVLGLNCNSCLGNGKGEVGLNDDDDRVAVKGGLGLNVGGVDDKGAFDLNCDGCTVVVVDSRELELEGAACRVALASRLVGLR